MDTATEVLIVGGMSVLAFGLLLGIPMAQARSKAHNAPRYLLIAHLAAIIQGGVLLALSNASGFSTMSTGVETVGAVLLVAGAALFGLGNVTNWLRGVKDGFAEKAVGNKISAPGTAGMLAGAGILLYGVVTSL